MEWYLQAYWLAILLQGALRWNEMSELFQKHHLSTEIWIHVIQTISDKDFGFEPRWISFPTVSYPTPSSDSEYSSEGDYQTAVFDKQILSLTLLFPHLTAIWIATVVFIKNNLNLAPKSSHASEGELYQAADGWGPHPITPLSIFVVVVQEAHHCM